MLQLKNEIYKRKKVQKMSKISEPGYLFIHSGILENNQIEECLKDSINFLSENFDRDFQNTEIEINVVKNREGKKYGHTYAWVSNNNVFNALIGKNFDGSELIEMVEDQDWEPPEEDYDTAIESASGSWAMMAEIADRYERPLIRKKLDPLVTLPGIKYTPEQELEVDGESKIGFLEVFDTKLTEKPGKLNTIFSDKIPEWITEEILLDRFKKFNKDHTVYVEKKSKRRFSYPIVKIKKKKNFREEKRYCTITFSPMFRNTSTFLINLVKRVEIVHGDNKALLFFSQSKSKNN